MRNPEKKLTVSIKKSRITGIGRLQVVIEDKPGMFDLNTDNEIRETVEVHSPMTGNVIGKVTEEVEVHAPATPDNMNFMYEKVKSRSELQNKTK